MRGRDVVIVVTLAGCGRIGFDPLHGASDGSVAGDGVDAQTIPAGALVWLKMDSGPTGGIIDSAGGHAAACVTGCPTLATGLHDLAYAFSAEEISVVSTGVDLDVATGFTGALWIRMISLPTGPNACPWSKQANGGNGTDTFALCVGPTGTVIFDGETPGNLAVTKMGPAIAVGDWHHVAITWDGTTRRDYLDGIQQFTTSTALAHSAESLELGSARGSFLTHATLDDALYYGRALSPAEIQQLATP